VVISELLSRLLFLPDTGANKENCTVDLFQKGIVLCNLPLIISPFMATNQTVTAAASG